MKRVVAVLISFLLVITTIPIYTFAETITGNYGVLSYEIIDGEVTITDCDSNAEGEIVIPSIIASCSVGSIGDGAFSNCKNLTDISLSQNCVTIGDWAFLNCSSISSIIIPNSLTDLGYGAFQGCSQLERITVGSGLIDVDLYCLDDFSLINNYECSNLKEIIIDESNPSYSSIDGVLFDKTNQELIYYPRGREGEYALPNTTRKIRSNAFRGCSKLTKINTLEGLTEIGDSAFLGSSISSFVIPNSVNVIGANAFQECDVLDSITLGDNISYIYSGTFAYCDNLSEINISASVESITISALYYCPKLKSINVDSNNGNYLSIDGVLFNKSGMILLKCPEGREGEYIIPNSVVNIETRAFDECENITKIIFTSSVIEIGTKGVILMSLTPEEQERKAENQKRNLLNQTLPVIDRSNQGSFKTRRRYKAVMNRFCGCLGENTTLQNFRNVKVRHVRSYIENLQICGCKPGYILTELSGIKWVHQRMNPKRNLPKSNKCFFVAKRQLYVKDKSILPHEFDDLIKVALDMGRIDAVIEAYMDRYFGLRHEEFVTLRVHQIEYALKYKQLNLTNTKGGRPRDIPVETKMQENILRRVLAYAQKNGKSFMDYVICDNHTNSVKKKSKSLDNWMNNNKKKFMDPERTKYKSPGKRPREQSIHWHSLRHLFYQETKERYKSEGRMTDAQIERELSESMGHSRNDVNNTYSNEIKRIR